MEKTVRERDANGRFVKQRKTKYKVCSKCGEKKIRKLHFVEKCSMCMECKKEHDRILKREEYRRNRKVPDGIIWNAKIGRVVEHNSCSTKIFWSEDMLRKLHQLFPYETNENCAIEIGVSPRTVVRKARELGLEKDPDWLEGIWEERRKMAQFVNKIKVNSGMIQKGQHHSPATEFKKKNN